MTATPAINVRGLTKRYGDLSALDGVSLTVRQGELFGLLGPNGAGKSTLIGLLAGLLLRDGGSAQVLGYDVEAEYKQSRRLLGVVPQEIVYDPFFNVRELLRLQSGYFGLRRNDDWIDELLAELDLGAKADTNMRALSGGMKRRVMIAQALVHHPKVLILDEPTAGVDVELRQTLWRFVRKLNANGTTVVLTTHYLEEAETLCERIAILRRGRLVACEDKEHLLAMNTLKTLRVTMAHAVSSVPPELDAFVKSQEGERLVLQYDRNRHPVNKILQALQSLDAEIVDLKLEEPDLEDVFLELTGSPENAGFRT